MENQLVNILSFMGEAFLHVWPYLLITIPLAVAVNMVGAAKYINRAFQTRPIIAIFAATIVGAFSPFCSCGVIPIIASLLIGGVPLAPVMSFWIASPSMDPEIFFLSVAMVGWKLAVWRLASTFLLSLSAGFITHFLMRRGWLGNEVLLSAKPPAKRKIRRAILDIYQRVKRNLVPTRLIIRTELAIAGETSMKCCSTVNQPESVGSSALAGQKNYGLLLPSIDSAPIDTSCGSECDSAGCEKQITEKIAFWRRLSNETFKATLMVAKFMALAFFLEALITLIVPAEWIAGLLGKQNHYSVLLAAAIGVPAYTSNLTALPMISGLLSQGMDPGAALAFLIAGPTTTLPAMAAVWGLVSKRVFFLYISFALLGAIVFGYIFKLASLL